MLLPTFHQLETKVAQIFLHDRPLECADSLKSTSSLSLKITKEKISKKAKKSTLRPCAFNSVLYQRHDFIQHVCLAVKNPVDHPGLSMTEITENITDDLAQPSRTEICAFLERAK